MWTHIGERSRRSTGADRSSPYFFASRGCQPDAVLPKLRRTLECCCALLQSCCQSKNLTTERINVRQFSCLGSLSDVKRFCWRCTLRTSRLHWVRLCAWNLATLCVWVRISVVQRCSEKIPHANFCVWKLTTICLPKKNVDFVWLTNRHWINQEKLSRTITELLSCNFTYALSSLPDLTADASRAKRGVRNAKLTFGCLFQNALDCLESLGFAASCKIETSKEMTWISCCRFFVEVSGKKTPHFCHFRRFWRRFSCIHWHGIACSGEIRYLFRLCFCDMLNSLPVGNSRFAGCTCPGIEASVAYLQWCRAMASLWELTQKFWDGVRYLECCFLCYYKWVVSFSTFQLWIQWTAAESGEAYRDLVCVAPPPL